MRFDGVLSRDPQNFLFRLRRHDGWTPGYQISTSQSLHHHAPLAILPSCRLAGSLVLLDLHHGKHLLDIEIEIVRLLGMPLDLPDQPRLVGIPQG
jgi:hypothetical protein